MTSGVYGVVRSIDGDFVRLEIADGVEIKIARRSVAARVEDSEAEPDDRQGDSPADSVDGPDIGQTPVSDREAPDPGGDGNEVVTGSDDAVETERENGA